MENTNVFGGGGITIDQLRQSVADTIKIIESIGEAQKSLRDFGEKVSEAISPDSFMADLLNAEQLSQAFSGPYGDLKNDLRAKIDLLP